MAQFKEPVHPVQIRNYGCISDEPVYGTEEESSVRYNHFVLKTGFSELEEVLSRFQARSSTGSDLDRAVYSINQRKLRRMVSNRESARRSRMRKRRHLENLKIELNQLKVQNQEFKNRVGALMWLNQMVQCENEHLKEESLVLRYRLGSLRQILVGMQLLNQGVLLDI